MRMLVLVIIVYEVLEYYAGITVNDDKAEQVLENARVVIEG